MISGKMSLKAIISKLIIYRRSMVVSFLWLWRVTMQEENVPQPLLPVSEKTSNQIRFVKQCRIIIIQIKF